jgi:hypothetical protein
LDIKVVVALVVAVFTQQELNKALTMEVEALENMAILQITMAVMVQCV